MAYWCQFCDKKLIIKQSVILVEDYITCGSVKCGDQARSTDNAIHKELNTPLIGDTLVIFSTTTPEDNDSWRILKERYHPDFIKNPDVMSKMVEGEIASLETKDHLTEKTETFYRAQKVSEILKQSMPNNVEQQDTKPNKANK
jgi:hypothetical protein